MTTPFWITGWEHGVNPISNGGGLNNTIGGTPTVATNKKNSGAYSLKFTTDGATAQFVRKNHTASQQVATVRCYVLMESTPSADWAGLDWRISTAAIDMGLEITNINVLQVHIGGGDTVAYINAMNYDQWYRIDMTINITGTTWFIDWAVDGVSQTRANKAGQATTDSLNYLRLGSATSSITTGVFYLDDLVLCENATDYPIGAGGTEILKPTSDGTHNAGTNVVEDNAGTDIGTTTAYDKIDAIPMSGATTYIQQAANGTGNYAEVQFNNIVSAHSSIIGAMGVLAYTSETTSTNNGGCIMSKDDFATQTVIWGVAGTLSDYSDGSTANPYYKSAILANVTDDATVNALEARIGYSSDASPDLYWLNLGVEVAYVPSVATGNPWNVYAQQ